MVGQNIILAINENFKAQFKNNNEVWIANLMAAKINPSILEDHKQFVRWNSPLMGWIKANFDGSAKGNPGNASCEGLSETIMGEWWMLL